MGSQILVKRPEMPEGVVYLDTCCISSLENVYYEAHDYRIMVLQPYDHLRKEMYKNAELVTWFGFVEFKRMLNSSVLVPQDFFFLQQNRRDCLNAAVRSDRTVIYCHTNEDMEWDIVQLIWNRECN